MYLSAFEDFFPSYKYVDIIYITNDDDNNNNNNNNNNISKTYKGYNFSGKRPTKMSALLSCSDFMLSNVWEYSLSNKYHILVKLLKLLFDCSEFTNLITFTCSLSSTTC